MKADVRAAQPLGGGCRNGCAPPGSLTRSVSVNSPGKSRGLATLDEAMRQHIEAALG